MGRAETSDPQLLQPQRPRGCARSDRRDAAVRRRGRPAGRGRGLSPHRPGGAQLPRPDRAQCGHVRPAGLCLRLPLLRHSLVPELRLRGEGLGQRRADPGASSRRKALPPCGGGAASPTSGCCAPGPAGCARRCASHALQNGLALDAPPFELFAREREGRDRGRPAHRPHQGGRKAVAIRRKGFAVSEQAVPAGA